MKKIPYGVIDYKTLKEENYLYIDKTSYLEKLENSEKTIIYLRPGRFGKSLFTSMMYYYYDINSNNLFETLFKDTYVYKNQTLKKNSYYVLKFDFSGINTANKDKKQLEEKFKSCVIQGLESFLSRYDIIYNLDYNNDADVMIKLFLSHFESLKLNNKIYVIVDEYDNFTNELLEGDASVFNELVGKDGVIKSFYANIKIYIKESIIDRFFATGICPITLNSMTTGFNIAVDKSIKPEFNTMIGLTHKEVLGLLDELELSKDEKDTIYDIMIKNYDGYLFSDELGEESRVFNATLVMYFLKEYLNEHKVPRILYDNNIVVNYGKIDNLIKLQNNKFYKELISDILDNGEVEGTIKTQYNLEEDVTKNDIISLLYYFGYLTIKKLNIIGRMVFKIPNYVMKETYGNYFLKLLRDENIEVDTKVQDKGLYEIVVDGKIDTITNYISELLRLLDNRLFMNMNESDIELLYFTLIKSDLINVYTEYPCNGGYADVYISGRNKPLKYNILIELKYIKKSEYTIDELKDKRKDALRQLKEYSLDDRIASDNLKKYVIIFVGDEVKLLEEID